MIKKFKRLFKASYFFKPPKKNKILIFDKSGSKFIQNYFANNTTILEVRQREINIFILFKTLFNFQPKKGISQNYIENFIIYINPKIIITHVDNNSLFFKLKKIFPNIIFIVIQNGTGLANIPENEFIKEKWFLDYFFVFSQTYQVTYEKFVKGKMLDIGSFKNNIYPRENSNKKNTNILFISQYRISKNYGLYKYENKQFSHSDFYLAEKKVVAFLSDFCKRKKIELVIAGHCDQSIDEENFFSNIINKNNDRSGWKFVPNDNEWSSYKLIDDSSIIVFIDSALGYESYARDKKTVSFSIRSQYLQNPQLKFGWPAKFDDDGPFWTNFYDKEKFENILTHVNNLTDDEWNKLMIIHRKKIISYNKENAKFQELISNLLD